MALIQIVALLNMICKQTQLAGCPAALANEADDVDVVDARLGEGREDGVLAVGRQDDRVGTCLLIAGEDLRELDLDAERAADAEALDYEMSRQGGGINIHARQDAFTAARSADLDSAQARETVLLSVSASQGFAKYWCVGSAEAPGVSPSDWPDSRMRTVCG